MDSRIHDLRTIWEMIESGRADVVPAARLASVGGDLVLVRLFLWTILGHEIPFASGERVRGT